MIFVLVRAGRAYRGGFGYTGPHWNRIGVAPVLVVADRSYADELAERFGEAGVPMEVHTYKPNPEAEAVTERQLGLRKD